MRRIAITKTIIRDDSISLKKYLQEIHNSKPLPPEEEAALAERIQNGDEEAVDKLVYANLKFVVSIAKQYQNYGMPLPDLINEGNIGLFKAAKRYKPQAKYKFISYAVYWIRQSILKSLADNGHMIRLPMKKIELLGKINKTISAFEQKHGRTPSDEEIAEILNVVDGTTVSDVIAGSKRSVSLDTPYTGDEDNDFSPADTLVNPDSYEAEKRLANDSLGAELNRALSTLDNIGQFVIRHLFGINTDVMDVEDIAEKLGMSENIVQQYKERGIRQLRNEIRSGPLKVYLDNLED